MKLLTLLSLTLITTQTISAAVLNPRSEEDEEKDKDWIPTIELALYTDKKCTNLAKPYTRHINLTPQTPKDIEAVRTTPRAEWCIPFIDPIKPGSYMVFGNASLPYPADGNITFSTEHCDAARFTGYPKGHLAPTWVANKQDDTNGGDMADYCKEFQGDAARSAILTFAGSCGQRWKGYPGWGGAASYC